MTVAIGKNYYIEWDGVQITSPYRSFTPGVMEETAEGTAAGDDLRTYVKTLDKAEPKGKFIIDSADTSILAVLVKGHTGTLIWGPRGNASGMPKAGIVARITKAEAVGEYDKELELEVEWVSTSGAWSFDPATATF